MESEHYKMLLRHDNILLYGNGKPGLTTRMAVVEEKVDKIDEAIESNGKKTDRLSWLVAIGIGIVIALQFLLKR